MFQAKLLKYVDQCHCMQMQMQMQTMLQVGADVPWDEAKKTPCQKYFRHKMIL